MSRTICKWWKHTKKKKTPACNATPTMTSINYSSSTKANISVSLYKYEKGNGEIDCSEFHTKIGFKVTAAYSHRNNPCALFHLRRPCFSKSHCFRNVFHEFLDTDFNCSSGLKFECSDFKFIVQLYHWTVNNIIPGHVIYTIHQLSVTKRLQIQTKSLKILSSISNGRKNKR